MVLGICPKDHTGKSSSITMSVNLNNVVMSKQKKLFVIGGIGVPQSGITTKDSMFTFVRKNTNKPNHNPLANFLIDGGRNQENIPFSIAVIYDSKMTNFKKFKIVNNVAVKIDDDLEEYVKKHLVDMVVYGTDNTNDR